MVAGRVVSRRRAMGAAVAAATAAALSAWAIGDADRNRAAADNAAGQSQAPLGSSFAIFRGGAHADPELPAYRSALVRHGLDPASTRAVGRAGRLYATANADTACLLGDVGSGTYGSACGDATAVAADGLFSVVYPKPGDAGAVATVSGLVPDGVESVVVVNADGIADQVQVTANGVQAALTKLPAKLQFRDVGGKQHTVPIDALDEGGLDR